MEGRISKSGIISTYNSRTREDWIKVWLFEGIITIFLQKNRRKVTADTQTQQIPEWTNAYAKLNLYLAVKLKDKDKDQQETTKQDEEKASQQYQGKTKSPSKKN